MCKLIFHNTVQNEIFYMSFLYIFIVFTVN